MKSLLLFLLSLTHADKNVLLLIADDMRPQLNETYGQPWMVTPNLDMLARESLVFDAAFSNFAICAASTCRFFFIFVVLALLPPFTPAGSMM